MAANVGATGYAPQLDYCDNIRGNYLENYYTKIASNTPEMTYASSRKLCEVWVAACRSLVYSQNNCETELPSRLQELGLSAEEINTEVAECKSTQADWSAKLEDLIKAFAESTGNKLEDMLTRWTLTEVRPNPFNEPTYFEAVETPGWFSDPRYDGKFLSITVEDGSIKYHNHHMDWGSLCYDANFVADFDSPPASMAANEEIMLTATTSGSGEVTGGYGCGWTGIGFEYRTNRGSFSGDTYASTDLNFITDTAVATLKAPSGQAGSEMTVSAFLWNCGACLVDYVYICREYDLIPSLLLDMQNQPINVSRLKPYYDIPVALPDIINHMKLMVGEGSAANSPRPADFTGDGRVGVDDTIYMFQSLTEKDLGESF